MLKQMVIYVDRKSLNGPDVGGVLTITYTADRDESWVDYFVARLSQEFTSVRRTEPREMTPLPG